MVEENKLEDSTSCSAAFQNATKYLTFDEDTMMTDKLMNVAENFFEEEEKEEARPVRRGVASVKTRTKWNDQEEEEINCLFRSFLVKRKQPSSLDCRLVLKKSETNSGIIHKRSVSAVKNKVIRMIKSLVK